MKTMNTDSLAVYKVCCEWKGRTAEFEVKAEDFDAACEVARLEVRSAVGMPKSSINRVWYVR